MIDEEERLPATMTMVFTEDLVPATIGWAKAFTDEEFMTFLRRNKMFRFERNREGETTVKGPLGGIASMQHMAIRMAVLRCSDAMRGKAIISDVGFNLADGSCLSPDVAWIRSEVWQATSRDERQGFLPICLDFVIEVRSPNDSRREFEQKMQRWMGNGTGLAWLVDPLEREVVMYRAREATETLERPDVVRGHEQVDGFEFDATEVWEEKW